MVHPSYYGRYWLAVDTEMYSIYEVRLYSTLLFPITFPLSHRTFLYSYTPLYDLKLLFFSFLYLLLVTDNLDLPWIST